VPIHLDKVEFYITNVCNLTCDNCNRFNNYNFRGWQSWDDYADIYARWAELIKIKQIVILGGEPLLNPTLVNWIKGMEGFDSGSVQILTNGTRLNSVRGLYDTVRDIRKVRSWIGVSIHNINEIDLIIAEVEKFLQAPITKTVGRGNTEFGSDYSFTDANRVRIDFYIQNEFTTGALINKNGRNTLHNSDPNIAHSACTFVQNKNYHFIHGKLYKCGPVALFPEFDEQFDLDISDKDRVLLNSYRPLTLENFDEYHEEFFRDLDNVIPQCKFCPETHKYRIIHPILKK